MSKDVFLIKVAGLSPWLVIFITNGPRLIISAAGAWGRGACSPYHMHEPRVKTGQEPGCAFLGQGQ